MRFDIRTQRREQMLEITHEIQEAVAASGVSEGWAMVFCPHTTAGVTVNEAADPDVGADILAGLAHIAPARFGWRHAEGNSDAHLKASLVGSSAQVPVVGGEIALGRWQGVFLCEFDGPRQRSIVVSVLEG